MRRTIFQLGGCVVGVIFFAASVCATDLQLPLRTYYGNAQVRTELVASPDGKDFLLRRFDPKGHLQKEEGLRSGAVQSDDREGKCAGNTRNGTVRCEIKDYQIIIYYPYREYQLDGVVRTIGEDGYQYITYRQGEKQGAAETMRHRGKYSHRSVEHYDHGKAHGKFMRFENGKLTAMVTFHHGAMDGPCLESNDWRERVGRCHGGEENFTGVERSYTTEYVPSKSKSKSGGTQTRVRRLESVRVYCDGKVVKETRTNKRHDRDRDGDKSSHGKKSTDVARQDAAYERMDFAKLLPAAQSTVTKNVSEKLAKNVQSHLTGDEIRYFWTLTTGYIENKHLAVLGFQPDDIVLAINNQEISARKNNIESCPTSQSVCTYRLFRQGKIVDLVLNFAPAKK